MIQKDLSCRSDLRRAILRGEGKNPDGCSLNGIDYVEIDSDQTCISVYFIGLTPEIEKENIVIEGGVRIKDVKVEESKYAEPSEEDPEGHLEIIVNHPGDFSTYLLKLVDRIEEQDGKITEKPMNGFDPILSSIDFSFKAGCPTGLDCKSLDRKPGQKFSEPVINYLAKDYSSFRQLIFDRLALILPSWSEDHVPDLCVALVELLAYAGDDLSYYQDAVASESYLETARQRISVRRHSRLVDYSMHEGCNSRSWIFVEIKNELGAVQGLESDQETDTCLSIPSEKIFFVSGLMGTSSLLEGMILEDDLRKLPSDRYKVFRPIALTDDLRNIDWGTRYDGCMDPLGTAKDGILVLREAHNKISFYTWGERECCIPAGSTRATLLDQGRKLALKKGDVLIFEEVIGPKTGNPDDADKYKRHAVRLTATELAEDKALGHPIVKIQWGQEDALPFSLCISAVVKEKWTEKENEKEKIECELIEDISVARGNVVLADHGDIVKEDLQSVTFKDLDQTCEEEGLPSEIFNEPSLVLPQLKKAPLTFYQPLILVPETSAAAMIAQDPRMALPWIRVGGRRILRRDKMIKAQLDCAENLGSEPEVCRICQKNWSWAIEPSYKTKEKVFSESCEHDEQWNVSEISSYTRWRPRADLLASQSLDRDFVLELDNFGVGHLRFGDGNLGRMPEAGTEMQAFYRIGNGKDGNVGQDMIRGLVISGTMLSGLVLLPRNPLPASGGTDPEKMEEAKLRAPYAFRKELKRAITAEDYSELAEKHSAVQKAATAIRWTGSWYEVSVAIDPKGRVESDESLRKEIFGHLFPYCRMGHELKVRSANYVPLYLEMLICVHPDYIKGHLRRDLIDLLSNRVLEDGRLGFFHPDNLTFGQSIRLSRIISTAQSVDGVASVSILRMHRLEFKDLDIGNSDTGNSNEENEDAKTSSNDWDEAILTGELKLGPMEIARLDNDPSFPENGQLLLKLEGGR